MTSGERGSERRIELYVRDLTPRSDRVDGAVLDRLEELRGQETVTDVDVYLWGEAIDPTGVSGLTEPGKFVRRRISQFEAWARRNDVTLNGFRTRSVRSSLTDTEFLETKLPVATIAEFVDGDLVWVAPCSADGSHYSVDDRLTALCSSGTTGVPLSSPTTMDLEQRRQLWTDLGDREAVSGDSGSGG